MNIKIEIYYLGNYYYEFDFFHNNGLVFGKFRVFCPLFNLFPIYQIIEIICISAN